MNVTKLTVRLTDEQRLRIIALVGDQRMAAFIRDAVDEKLEREAASAADRRQGR